MSERALTFTVRGDPRPKLRPRAMAMRAGGGKITARVYDNDKACARWKRSIELRAKLAMLKSIAEFPLQGPIGLYVTAYHARPKRLLKPSSPDGPMWRPVKPDFDNLAKPIADVLSGIGLWRDDGQVCEHHMLDLYVAKGESPGIVVEVVCLDGVGP